MTPVFVFFGVCYFFQAIFVLVSVFHDAAYIKQYRFIKSKLQFLFWVIPFVALLYFFLKACLVLFKSSIEVWKDL